MNILLFYISAVCSLGAVVVIFIFTFKSFHFVTPLVTKLGGRWKRGEGYTGITNPYVRGSGLCPDDIF